jgi:pimeloyl-ACP methyl ester carboxylesterase
VQTSSGLDNHDSLRRTLQPITVIRWAEQTTRGNGVRLHVRRVVEPEAPPVLLLHGLGVGGSIWQAFARRLMLHLAAVAPDLRGHGHSDAPATGYAPPDYAADLAAMIDDLKLPTPLPVIGHSLGALVALALADARPDLVRWLALLDPPLDRQHRNPEIPSVFELRHAPEGELERYLLERNPGGGQLLAQSLAKLFRQAADATFEAMLQRDDREPPTPSVPCLIVQADSKFGGVLGDEAASAFAKRLPQGSRLVKIEGAPHAVHASHPDQVAHTILTFGGYMSSAQLPAR